MKKVFLIYLTVLSSVLGYSQYAVGTFSFSNSGGSGSKNVWTNSFNWVQWNGSAFVVSGTTPTSANDVIINIDNLITTGTTINNVNSANRLVVDATSSCKSFSVVGTSTTKGIRLSYGITLNVYGDFDLSGTTKCFFDAASVGGWASTLNLTGTTGGPFNIKTNNNVLDLYRVYVNGNYQLQDNYTQFPTTGGYMYDYVTGLVISNTGTFNTNGYRLGVYYFSCDVSSTVNLSNSILNLLRLDLRMAPTTTGTTEEIYFSDTLGGNGGINSIYISIWGGGALNARKISCYHGTQTGMYSYVSAVVNCKLFELNTSLNINPVNAGFSGVVADTFRVKDKAIIHLTNGNTFKTIETPGVCDKLVTFKAGDNVNLVSLAVTSAITLNYTSWLLMNITGAGNITANNSIDLGNNTGNITINSGAARTLAWCGSVDSDWNNSNNWRLLSGGGCSVCPPTNVDSVVFDPVYLSGASTKTVEIKSTAYCNGISFLYPTNNLLYVKGTGILFNGSGIWIGYPSGLTANATLTGTDWTNFTGQFIMNSRKKMVMIATQNATMNALGTAVRPYNGGVTFMGGGEWFFKDDFTAKECDFKLTNGRVLCSTRNLTFIAAQVTPQANKIAKLNLDTCLFKITGTGGYFYTQAAYSYKLFVIGGKSTVLFDGTSTLSGGSYYSNPALGIYYYALDSTGARSVNFWNVKFTTNIPYATASRFYGANGGGFFVHKLTLPPTFYSSAEYMGVGDKYPYLEMDTLNVSDCNKYTLHHYSVANDEAIKVNQAIVTSTVCGVYNNIFSDDATLPADIIVPSDFGTTKVLVQNVKINNGAGTLTASSSIMQGITNGWVAPVSSGSRLYWNGEGNTTNWDEPRNWNYNIPPTSGGGNDGANNPSNCVPGPLDSVFFTNNAFPGATNKVTLKKACYAKTITWNLTDESASGVTWSDTTGATLHVYESLLMNNRPNITYAVNTYFWGTTATNSVQSTSRVFPGRLYFEGSGTYHLVDSLSAYIVYVNLGTFNTHRKNVNVVGSFYSYKPTVRAINIKGSRIYSTSGYGYDYVGGWGCWHYNSTNATLQADSSSIYISGAYGPGIFWLGLSTLTTTGPNAVHYNKVVFYGNAGGQLNSGSDDLYRFNRVDFLVPASLINGNNRIDTLLYDPMSVNELQVGKTQSIDSLRAISNNCQNLVIKSTTNNSHAYLCDIGSFKKLTATFGDIIDVRSNSCTGFGLSNETFNGGVTNSPGWIVSPNSLQFGFPIPRYTVSCENGPLILNANGFYAGAGSTYTWSNGSHASSTKAVNYGTYSLTVTYKAGCAISDTVKVTFESLSATNSTSATACVSGAARGAAFVSLTSDSTSSHTYQYTLQSSVPSTSITYSNSPFMRYSNLSAGNYTVTIKDTTASSVGCTYTQTLNVPSSGIICLPIELISFTSYCSNNTTILNWETGSETNNQFYTIKKSTDAINWVSIGNVNSVGNSSSKQRYVYTDDSPFTNEIVYYQLIQTDIDGSTTEYNIISENCKNSNELFDVFGNTITSNTNPLTIYTSFDGEHQVTLFDAIGKLIFEEKIILKNGANPFIKDFSLLSNGIYFLRIEKNTKIKTIKLMVNKTQD